MIAGRFVNEVNVFRQVWKVAVLKNSKLAVKLVAGLARPVSHQIMDAAVNEIVAVLPRFRHAARLMMMFKNPGFIAIHSRVTTRRKAGEPGPDDDDGFFSQGFAWFFW